MGWAVRLVHTRQMKFVPGRKSNVQVCQCLQKLMSLGFVRAAFRPGPEVCVVQAVARQRKALRAEQASWVQLLQKALVQMNIQLTDVVTDVMGATGLAIMRAIDAGERHLKVLDLYRNSRIKASQAEIAGALKGNWRDEHVVVLSRPSAMPTISTSAASSSLLQTTFTLEIDAISSPTNSKMELRK